MKCPRCGFNSFDYLSSCKKCGSPLEEHHRHRVIYESVAEGLKQNSAKVDEDAIEKPVSGARLPEPNLSLEQASFRISNEPRILSSSTDALARDKNKNKEDESPSSSIPSDFLPYKSSSDESQQGKQVDTRSPVSSASPVYHFQSKESQSKEEAISFDLAGIGSRVTAFIIDLILIFGIATLTLGVGLFCTGTGFRVGPERFMNVLVPIYFILLFLGSTYFVFLEGFAGKTVGKMIVGIKIIRGDGESMGLWEAFVRWLGYFVSAFFIFIGFIWAIFDSKGQAWHDKFAGTYVVKE
jgi:uncharacterized RDD family membrane protein YckC